MVLTVVFSQYLILFSSALRVWLLIVPQDQMLSGKYLTLNSHCSHFILHVLGHGMLSLSVNVKYFRCKGR